MKKLFSAFTAMLFLTMLSPNTLAHTHLTETNPADGATVTEPLTQLTLQFDGQVGEGSFITLSNSADAEIAVPTIEIGNMNMTATLAEPLPNDSYKVSWSIISADGHPLEGSYTFTVNAPVEEAPVTEDNLQEAQTTIDKTTDEAASEQSENKSNSTILIIAAVLAVVIVGSLFALLMRKK